MTSTRLKLQDLRPAGAKKIKPTAMLTCYDFSTAKHLAAAGVKAMLVGDSAANVILGHDSTIPVSLDFMIELTAAVRRGAPDALVVGDLPFGSYANKAQAVKSAVKMLKLSGCDCVKLETSRGHLGQVMALADNGVAVVAHLGLKPQSVKLLGGYKAQGRDAESAMRIVDLAQDMVLAGAAAVLLEAVPPQVPQLLSQLVDVPIIGCGAGPECHAHVVVLNDVLGMSDHAPRFVPRLGEVGKAIQAAAKQYIKDVQTKKYPSPAQTYPMPEDQLKQLESDIEQWGLGLST
jgi:3-methyl-2-oxobutanoate hydroxymethyltransferase